ncbi:MAG TPA: SUF system NifU family Fe-S cluster assembly protein [Methylomirabilota bacterium]|jgi:nitrogen fixation NifU-like protein|nr:SUF system NifU family Fe-S cluster assembly protein [Methylomirabilota bacterium]
MSELRDLYQQVILDHNRKPRNFRKLPLPTQTAEGYNPLCGDRVSVELELEGDLIRDIAFQGSGCAISKASASMMTAGLKGKTVDEAEKAFEQFHGMLTDDRPSGELPAALGKLAAFAGVREFPIRIKCATLPWHTLRAALLGKAEPVSTE